MREYLKLLQTALDQASPDQNLRMDRTGVGTLSFFAPQSRYDLSQGFPLVTTKKLHLRSIIHELLWFIQGSTNIDYLKKNRVTIWDEWADENGDLGPVYGAQWRRWQGDSNSQPIDQLKTLIEGLKQNPYGRRHVVSAWNVGRISEMRLPPCHVLFQCYVKGDRLSLQLYQRSADLFLGVPFNIASYALLTCMIAQVCGLKPGEFVHTLGDAHLYLNHVEQAKLQLSREPYPRPTLVLNPEIREIEDFKFEDIQIKDYQSHPTIKAPVAV